LSRRGYFNRGLGSGVGSSAAFQAADGPDLHVLSARNLAGEAHSTQLFFGQLGFLGRCHNLRLTLKKLNAAGCAASVSSASVQNVDPEIPFDCQDQALAGRHIHRSEPLDCQLWHDRLQVLELKNADAFLLLCNISGF